MNLCDEFAHENPIIIPCPDSAGARKGAKGSRKRGVRAVFGYHNFGQPPHVRAVCGRFCLFASHDIPHLPIVCPKSFAKSGVT